MTEEMIKHLHEKYSSVCNEYLRIFCEKYDRDFDPDCWVGGKVGEIAQITEDTFVDLRDMITDCEIAKNRREYFLWSDYIEQVSLLNLRRLNYESWLKGAPRIPQDTIDRLFKMRRDFEDECERTREDYNKQFKG